MNPDEPRPGTQITPGRPPEPESRGPARDFAEPVHGPLEPRAQVRQEPRRFTLPDWSKATWAFAVLLAVMVIFAFIAALSDPSLAAKWVEAMFGKVGGLIGG